MLRASDKLAEAEFFFRLLKRSNGAQPRAKYYASATFAACRSVSWVLQADLRPKHGGAFDSWWLSQQATLASAGIGFADLRDGRNLAEKTGFPLVMTLVRHTFPDGEIAAIDFVVDPGHEALSNFHLELRTLGPANGRPPIDDSMPEAPLLLLELKRKITAFGDAWRDGRAVITPVFGHNRKKAFDQLVLELDEYIKALRELLARASVAFAV